MIMIVDGGGFWETEKLRNLEAIPLDDQVFVIDHEEAEDCDDDDCDYDDGDYDDCDNDDNDLVLQGAELNLAMQTKRSPSLSDSTGKWTNNIVINVYLLPSRDAHPNTIHF